MRRTRAAAILLAGASLILMGGALHAQTPPVTPPGPSPCTGLVQPTPGGPAAPSNLSALWGPLPDVPGASGVLLTWQDNAEDETCQVVQRKGPGDVEWQDKAFLSANADSTDNRGFEALGEYCYRVFAANERGASVSNDACVQVPEVTLREGLPPGAPPPSYPTLPPGMGPSPAVPAPTATVPGTPQAQQPLVTITASGPTTAAPGSDVTYEFSCVIEGGPGAGIAATWHGDGTTYVSQRAVSGGGQVEGEPAVGDTAGVVFWGLPQGSGVVTMTLRIPADATGGTINVGAYEPGTQTTSSNTVTTTIVLVAATAPAAAPATGQAGPTGGAALPTWLPGLALAAAFAAAAAAAWQAVTARRRSRLTGSPHHDQA